MTYEQIKTTAKVVAIVLPLIAAFYILVIKPKQHEKNEKKRNRKAEMEQTDTVDIDQLINDYPTYTRNNGAARDHKVKNP